MACITSATTTTTWCPISYQLRFAFRCDNSSHSVSIRTRIRNFNHPVHLFAFARSGNGVRPSRCKEDLKVMSSDPSVDGFAGWSGSDDKEEESREPGKNRFFKGIFGAGLVGVIFVAGLTAAMFLNKRVDSRKTQQMEPLTTQQEVSLDTETENDGNKDEGSPTADVLLDDSTGESDKGTDQDSLLRSDLDENTIENRSGDDINNGTSSWDTINNTTHDIEATNNALPQEDLQNESAFDDTAIAPIVSTSSTELPDSMAVDSPSDVFVFEDTNGDSVVTVVQLTSAVTEDMVDLKPTNSFITDIEAPGLNSDYKEEKSGSEDLSHGSSYESGSQISEQSVPLDVTLFDGVIDYETVPENDKQIASSISIEREVDLSSVLQVTVNENYFGLEAHNLDECVSSGPISVSTLADPSKNEQDITVYNDLNGRNPTLDSSIVVNSYSLVGIPAPSAVSEALQVLPGKILVPAVVDQVHGQALAALQVLKVIEADVLPSDLCTRREYARWLVSASSSLSRNTSSKVYPAMYIENVTELAFDDITLQDPDFSSIQGLAEAGLISSKLSRSDLLPSDEEQSPLFFHPESPLSRQDLVSWKMALEKTQLPETDKMTLYKLSGFIDIDKIDQEAWPALVADISAGEQGITALAFGYTRLFQPIKPVTKAQAAIALSTGEASDMVNEELARIEAETMAENAVSAHSALVAEVEKDINASFEKELSLEREKISVVEKMAEEAKCELEKLRAQCEEDNISLMKERTAVESQMEVLLKLRGQLEVQLESLMSNKIEMAYEKERISTLRKDAEFETKEITRLQYELEVERKALSMARSWAEDEAKKAREQAKFLEEARDRWEKHGIKVVVDPELQEDASAGVTWLNAREELSVEETISKGENLTDKLKTMALEIQGKSKERINQIIKMIQLLVTSLKEWMLKVGRQTIEIKNCAISKARASTKVFQQSTVELKDASIVKARESAQAVQQKTAEFNTAVKEGAKRVAGDCRGGVEKFTQKFKA